jgi:crotonobetaine/carnitine-CoA ligase
LGRPSPYYDVRVVDEADEPVPDGTAGELVVRPKEPESMMSGYLGRPEATLAAWRDFWYHTGDLVRVRRDGYLEFVERRNDAIRRRGENISAWEIESLVMGLPGVEEAAVIGVDSELGDQDVLLVITVRRDGPSERELFNHCRERLPYYMVPRYVRIVQELPKTPSLRVQKYRLREAGVAAGTWDAEAHGLRVRRPQAV